MARRAGGDPADEDYRSLAEWRYAIRRFLAASEEITRSAGVSPTQYQLLLFIRGNAGRAPTVADLAERLQIRHQSAVGLIDRCEAAGFVRRRRDEANRRRVFVTMTPRGAALLKKLAAEHFATIERLGSSFEPPLRLGSRRKTGSAPFSVRRKRS
ncbi:MAG: MarR family transcriptional regulator [Acidobacteriota bacterium]|nr:MarR family transcriptional regulator [Acidobacteriota bacterium]